MSFRLTVNGAAYPAPPDVSILAALTEGGCAGIAAPCGGMGRCRKCAVVATGPVRSLETGETRLAERERLLACQFAPAGDLEIEPPGEDLRVAAGGAAAIAAGGKGLGAAVDIGTTTVALLLYDLSTGKLLCSAGERNAQRGFGADVISRIAACGKGKLPVLRDAIRRQIRELTERLCRSAGRDASEITRAAVAGNTVMEHLYAGLDPSGIGVAPFTPASLFGERLPVGGLTSETYMCPCVSGYVGGDIAAGLLASGGDRTERLWLYMDIGTNGEMALGDRNGYLTCATAAGPAFEGAEIACGMDGSPGAVDRVRAENGDVKVHVIDGAPPVGLCGSGLIDAVAALLDLGVIDGTGRMADAEELSPLLSPRMFFLEDGQTAFRLAGGVYLSARDVRQVQLAKAAIRAGAETLLARSGRKAEDIGELVIAGGFGSFLDKDSALRIGMLPRVDPARIRHVGNAASAGAALALSPEGEARLAAFAEKLSYLELSTEREFMDRYVESMMFDEDDRMREDG